MRFLLLLSTVLGIDLDFNQHLAGGKEYTVQEYKAKCNDAWPLFFEHARCVVTGGDKCANMHRKFKVDPLGHMNATLLHNSSVERNKEMDRVIITGSCGDNAVRLECFSDDQQETSFIPLCELETKLTAKQFHVYYESEKRAMIWLDPKLAPTAAKPINFRVMPIGNTRDTARSSYDAFAVKK